MQPVVLKVFGDKERKLEPEHHRIEFPGGFISLDRTTDGRYWAHISTAKGEMSETHQGQADARVVSSRVDFNFAEYKRRHKSGEPTTPEIPGVEWAEHLAVCIEPIWLNRS